MYLRILKKIVQKEIRPVIVVVTVILVYQIMRKIITRLEKNEVKKIDDSSKLESSDESNDEDHNDNEHRSEKPTMNDEIREENKDGDSDDSIIMLDDPDEVQVLYTKKFVPKPITVAVGNEELPAVNQQELVKMEDGECMARYTGVARILEEGKDIPIPDDNIRFIKFEVLNEELPVNSKKSLP
ncbi:hypothetical protein QAD02_016699 [Eretmocerus hayati]|uniref:Uncharacterized protein n=1 Tax=Eretmocerus hayati TaxID=131215 RepID=A0ACC2PBV4_9HYME|nr:hypothetical protein QAD02_016699 [Eretmocerus hayati]